MAICEKCGNDYDKTFVIDIAGEKHTFDSFECAISSVAPKCKHCKCTIIGHGVEDKGGIYCSAHCAKQRGVEGVHDRV
jgi:hypothetical protein